MMGNKKNPRILAVSSAGGHWVQLRRLRPAWDGCSVAYITTKEGYREDVMLDAAARQQPAPRFYCVIDANRWHKVRLLRQLLHIVWILLRERPHVIVSTGAAAGYFAMKIGKVIGARTIWLDSMANAETMSLAGKMAGPCADLWLTQWEQVVGSEDPENGRPEFKGSVV